MAEPLYPPKASVAQAIGLRAREAKKRQSKIAQYRRDTHSLVIPIRNDLLSPLAGATIPIDDCKLPARSLRKAYDLQVERVRSSIQMFGFRIPIIVDKNNIIIDGVARWKAAKELGLEKIYVVIIEDLTPAQKRLLRLALNKIPLEAEWSLDELKIEFEELRSLEAPIEVTGFATTEIEQLIFSDDGEEPAKTSLEPEVEDPPKSSYGDIYLLDKHLVGCGDATDAEFVAQLLRGKEVQLAIHDPPFNVPMAGHISPTHTRDFVQGAGEMSAQDYVRYTNRWLTAAKRFMRDGALIGIFSDWRISHLIADAAIREELELLNIMVWAKTSPGLSKFYRSQHEFMHLYKFGTEPHINNISTGKAGRSRSNLWTYPGASSFGSEIRKQLKYHPTVKPVEMLKDFIIDVTHPKDWIFDAFLGSGSTLIAAEKTGRFCVGLDLDPQYVDLAIRRWEAETGKYAQRLPTAPTRRPPPFPPPPPLKEN